MSEHRQATVDALTSMGFAEYAAEAADIFDSDVQAAIDWALRKSTIGTMPKRFKRVGNNEFNYTFYNSLVSIGNDDYRVVDYDPDYQFILIEPRFQSIIRDEQQPDPRWIALADPSLTWNRESHMTKPELQPINDMKHCLGNICLPIDPAFTNAPGAFNPNSDYQQQQGAFFTDELCRINSQGQPVGNLPNMYNRLRVMKSRCPALGVIWQSLLYYSDKYHEGLRITPNTPEPRCINNKRLRWTKTIAYTRMMLILEYHGHGLFRHGESFDLSREFICGLPRLFKDSDQPELVKKIPELMLPLWRQYNRPNNHMRRKKKEWLDACASVFTLRDAEIVSYDGEHWSGNYFKAKIYMSDLIFANGRSLAAESMNWLHLKNIMLAVEYGMTYVTRFPSVLIHKCEGLPEPSTPSMSNHGIAYYDHYNQMTLVEWGKVFLEWGHRKFDDEDVLVAIGADELECNPGLYPHQAAVVNWMELQEMMAGTGEAWTKTELTSGFVMYRHAMGNIMNQEMYDNYILTQPSGGILAQAVGSGKTKEMLFLIRNRKEAWRKEFLMSPDDVLNLDGIMEQYHKTLVVVPTTMISTWEEECKRWTPELKVNVYYGNRRKIPPGDVSDIVITTYRTVCSELSFNSANIKHQALGAHYWKRVILDEGHHIRDMGSRTFKAINNIKLAYKASKWIITATPVIKSVTDMCAYFAFLGVYPWVNLAALPHHSYISRSISSIMYALSSYSETYPTIANGVRERVRQTMWYQSKQTVAEISDLKPASINDVTITIPADESHSKLMGLLREQIDERVKSDPTANNYSQRLKWMSWLRFCAFNPAMVPTAAYGRAMTKTSEAGMPVIMTSAETLNLPNVTDKFQASLKNDLANLDNQRCPVCLDTIDTPTITACGHIFCFECINNAFIHQQTARKKCPCCRQDLQNSVLREIKMEDSVSGTDKDFSICEHPMVGATEVLDTTIEELKTWRDVRSPKVKRLVEWFQSTDEKCLVFTSLSGVVLGDIQQALQEADIKHVVVSGSMTRHQRARAIDTFQNDKTCRAFLLTTRSASYGLTLTAASSIIFFEPCMNRSLRDQCIGRMDRIGQKKKCLDVITFAVEGSIEEKLAEVVKVKNWSFKDVNL